MMEVANWFEELGLPPGVVKSSTALAKQRELR